ncbi:M28 family metallopeptidase [Cytophagaceae bacterium YF14B1]|uniref:M28 family metallopeptidase n=1 Tax=Xanthocytophaga flava TaxID=3048013 RepID=A0AAE3UB22_9BACT|nr:M28 family metallopeptidase [Xanthocytophaga flavus]MDJ1486061.1 M28 family metallopeptidase [Xanthocytophaga flavus]
MKKYALQIVLLLNFYSSFSQQIITRDPEIAALVSQVSRDSLQAYVNKLVTFGTRHTMSVTNDKKKGIGASRQWVLSKFQQFASQSEGRMTAMIDTWTLKADGKRVDKDQEIGNVMATLKGTDLSDNRIFIVSGHIDSRVTDVMNRTSDAPGANDDGSGTAAVIELARILAKSKFSATIIFVAVSGEEQGLLGAEHLAEKAVTEKWNIEAVLNNDIMGSNNSNETNIIDNTRLRVFSEGLPAFEIDKKAANIRQYGLENDGKARQLARYVKEVGERYVENLEVVMVYRNDRFLRGGDHTPFVTKGFAAVRFSEMNENFLHQHQDLRTEKGVEYGDFSKFMDFEYLRKNTCINLANLANLAKSPGMPREVLIEVSGLSNSTTLTWQAPEAGKPKGYYILMRETYQPFWQKKFFTTELKLTLPYSKDNYFFAVQAVSESGNESLPVIPLPKR